MLLDLSVALNTVDHTIQIRILGGASGTVLNWCKSYLQDRNYFVSIGDFVSEQTNMTCGVSQGSTSSSSTCPHYGKSCKITMFNVHHCYADDIQIYVALSPIDYRPIDLLYECIEQVKDWMCQNGLQLNEDKTKIIVFGAKTEQLKKTPPLSVPERGYHGFRFTF